MFTRARSGPIDLIPVRNVLLITKEFGWPVERILDGDSHWGLAGKERDAYYVEGLSSHSSATVFAHTPDMHMVAVRLYQLTRCNSSCTQVAARKRKRGVPNEVAPRMTDATVVPISHSIGENSAEK
jgi:hypothetical protein